jgi:hypothetical protein
LSQQFPNVLRCFEIGPVIIGLRRGRLINDEPAWLQCCSKIDSLKLKRPGEASSVGKVHLGFAAGHGLTEIVVD